MENLLNFESFINEQNLKLIDELYYILDNCTEDDTLNEGKYLDMLKNKFSNFGDFSKTVKALAAAGVISVAALTTVINKSDLGTDGQRMELIQEIENEKEDDIYAKSFDFSYELIDHLKSYETFHATPYYATKKEKEMKRQTIGYGHLIKSTDPDWIKKAKNITEKQARDILDKDIEEFHKYFMQVVHTLPKHLQDPTLYTQGFIDAAISIMFNTGKKNFVNSPFYTTWTKCRIDKETSKIRLDDYNYTCSMIKKSCITQKGKVLKGLVNRRLKEYRMAEIIKTEKEVG